MSLLVRVGQVSRHETKHPSDPHASGHRPKHGGDPFLPCPLAQAGGDACLSIEVTHDHGRLSVLLTHDARGRQHQALSNDADETSEIVLVVKELEPLSVCWASADTRTILSLPTTGHKRQSTRPFFIDAAMVKLQRPSSSSPHARQSPRPRRHV